MWIDRLLLATLLLVTATGCSLPSAVSRQDVLPTATASAATPLAGTPPQAPRPHYYPDRPVTLLVGATKGSNADLAARLLSASLERELQYPVVVSNRSGGDGLEAWTQLKLSRADGYTLALIASPQLQVSMLEAPGAPPLSLKDFVPLSGHLPRDPTMIFARNGSPYRGIEEFVAAARGQRDSFPASIPYKSAVCSLAAEELQRQAGVKLKVTAFSDSANALMAALNGQAEIALGSYSSALPMVRSGQGRFLAVLSQERLSGEAAIPTLREKGIDVVSQTSLGYALPQNVATDILDYLNWAIYLSVSDASYQSKLKDAGFLMSYMDGKQFASLLASEGEQVGRLLKK